MARCLDGKVNPVHPKWSLSLQPELAFRPQHITVSTVADLVFYCLFMYANEWREKSHCRNSHQQWRPPLIAISTGAWTQAQVVNSNSTSTGKETHRKAVSDHTQSFCIPTTRECNANFLTASRVWVSVPHLVVHTTQLHSCRGKTIIRRYLPPPKTFGIKTKSSH